MVVDTFTELLRVSVYIVVGLLALAAIITFIEWAAALIRRHQRRPWWRSESHGKEEWL